MATLTIVEKCSCGAVFATVGTAVSTQIAATEWRRQHPCIIRKGN